MTQADRIRRFTLDQYVSPARAGGLPEVKIRAGDVHQAMGLANALPAVCSAIGSNKFAELAGIVSISRTGPAAGANVYFQFGLSARPSPTGSAVSLLWPVPRPPQTEDAHHLHDALVLVSCVKSKLPHSAPARSLYTSAWFQKARDIVEASRARWFVLSALYGLVAPDAVISPYDHTLNTLGIVERREWARIVLTKLMPEVVDERRVVMFAGYHYREFLVGPLRQRGIAVDVPMENLRHGEQLAWLSEGA